MPNFRFWPKPVGSCKAGLDPKQTVAGTLNTLQKTHTQHFL
jgi:hypothetical protein